MSCYNCGAEQSPKWHVRTIEVASGRSGRSVTFSKSGTRVNSGRRYYRNETVEICEKCRKNEIRTGLILTAAIFVGLAIFGFRPQPPQSNASSSVALAALDTAPPTEMTPAPAPPAPPEQIVAPYLSAEYSNCLGTASASVDMLDCIGAERDRQNKELDRVYHHAMQNLSATERDELRRDEREWIAARDAACQHAGADAGGTVQEVAVARCGMIETARRVIYLGNYTVHPT